MAQDGKARFRNRENGEGSLLREDGAKQGAMDARGGQGFGRLHTETWPWQLESPT